MYEELTKLLKSNGEISELNQALILTSNECQRSGKEVSNSISIEGTWNFKNHSSHEKISMNILYTCDLKQNRIRSTPPVIADSKLILSAVSPCYSKVAHILQDDDVCFLNISHKNCYISVDLKKENAHGKIYKDGDLSSLCWSFDSKYLAYVAEKKSLQAISNGSKNSNSGGGDFVDKQEYVDDWGEQLSGFRESVVAVVELKSSAVKVLHLPNGLCGGQVVWTSEGGLVGVAFKTDPYRLGLIYCPNRESVIFHMDRDGSYCELTKRGNHVHSPRFSPDGSKLIYIQCPVGGPHVRSAQLCLMNWKNKEVVVLIDYISTKLSVFNDEIFHGLCGASILPKNCWLHDSQSLVFTALDNFVSATFILNTDTKNIKKVSSSASIVAHDVRCGHVLASFSSLTEPTRLALIPVPLKSDNMADAIFISSPRKLKDIPTHWQDKLKFSTDIPHPNFIVSEFQVPSLYFGPILRESEDAGKRPLIVWIHGGPHGMIKNEFLREATFFVRLGYSILFPNYRGSLGQGKDALESLPGHIGTADVSDVYNTTVKCLKRYRLILDETRVALYGGSHGGFLVTHLSAQYPDLYKVVSTRNPVTDIASMVTQSDIPDWTFVEAVDGCYTLGRNLNSNTLSMMHEKSPLSLVDKVRAPTLILLGKEDRRVPLSQGIFYFKMLLSRNVDTKAYIYDDNHPLRKPEVEADCLIKTVMWFKKYL